MDNSKRKILEKLLRKRYGYLPRMNEYKGRIYISDPNRPSEPWAVWDNEFEAFKELSN